MRLFSVPREVFSALQRLCRGGVTNLLSGVLTLSDAQ